MNRLGFRAEDPPEPFEGLELVMSHLACADAPAHPMNRAPARRLRRRHAPIRGRCGPSPTLAAASWGRTSPLTPCVPASACSAADRRAGPTAASRRGHAERRDDAGARRPGGRDRRLFAGYRAADADRDLRPATLTGSCGNAPRSGLAGRRTSPHRRPGVDGRARGGRHRPDVAVGDRCESTAPIAAGRSGDGGGNHRL